MAQDYVVGPSGPGGSFNAGHGAALYLPNRKHPALMLQNTGTATLFASEEDPISAPSPGQPVSAGSTLNWDKDRALYVTCKTSTTLTITQNTGGLYDVGALAAQVSAALTAGGLAQAIASAIYVTGTPPVDKFTGINDSGNQTNSYVSPNIDTSGYRSVGFLVDNTVGTPVTNGMVLLQWFSATGAPVGTDTFAIGLGSGTQATFPVRGAILIIQIFTTGSFRIYTYGSFKDVDHVSYLGNGTGSGGNGTVVGSGLSGVQTWSSAAMPASAIWDWQPDSPSGRMLVSTKLNTVLTAGTTSPLITYRSANSYNGGSNVFDVDNRPGVAVSGQVFTHNIILPPAPFEIEIANGTTIVNFRITCVSERPY